MAARISKSQERAHDALRKAWGILEEAARLEGTSPWRVIGAVGALVEMALWDLCGPENTEDSPAYTAGAKAVQGWNQPSLWDEV